MPQRATPPNAGRDGGGSRGGTVGVDAAVETAGVVALTVAAPPPGPRQWVRQIQHPSRSRLGRGFR